MEDYEVDADVDERIVRLEKVISALVAALARGDGFASREEIFETYFRKARDGDTESAAKSLYASLSRPESLASLATQVNAISNRVRGLAGEYEFLQESQRKINDIQASLYSERENILQEIQELSKGFVDFSVNYKLQNRHEKSLLSFQDKIETKTTELGVELHSLLYIFGLGLRIEDVPIARYIPVRVYLSEESPESISRVSAAIGVYLESFGADIADEFPSESGSWFKKWFSKTHDLVTEEEVQLRLKKAERAIELAALQGQQAAIDKNQADAASVLIKSIENTPNAVCQIGSILIIKVTNAEGSSQIYTRSMGPEEMIYLEQNQHLLKDPHGILDALSVQTKKPMRKGEIDFDALSS